MYLGLMNQGSDSMSIVLGLQSADLRVHSLRETRFAIAKARFMNTRQK